jgi:tetratricopeptide (TPR) repeat protein
VALLAIQKLEDAEASGISLGTVKWRLVDLYCDIGQPDRAIPYLDNIGDDPNLSTGPGSAPFRQGRVYFLLGNYRTATELWEQYAIPQLKIARTQAAIQSGLGLLRSNPVGGLQSAMDVPGQLLQQAEWEYLLGLAYLESGEPSKSAIHLQAALELNPELGGRAIAVEYLNRMGVEVPASTSGEPSEATPTAERAEAPAIDSPESKSEVPQP